MTQQTFDWPRLYLLNLYRQAVEQGHIVVEQLTKPKADSLRMAFYRLRRRADKSNQSFILPEYHLVTCGEWTQYPDEYSSGLGCMSILYNSIPEGHLPPVRNAATGELLAGIDTLAQPAPYTMPVMPPVDGGVEAGLRAILGPTDISEADISSYVANLAKRATSDD